ncbi:type II secretion system F family protein [Halalkalibacter krulwichiae]|uniref:Type IV pilin biogenesis protein n=1 Tax=Halalkalibacter krulwichiae TaxID=199441 RepID=A0A1X9MDF0_9BACI|nr:type II secretion system F family protein [Halalkalibacter krulwichiae]ARK31436.1 type IV pilin biogenesis protein [Halalkalibacter krulwichiae]
MNLFNKDSKGSYQVTAKAFIRIGSLLDQGYPLETALSFIKLHVKRKTKEQLEVALEQLKEGHSVHESFQSFEIPSSIRFFLYFYEQQGDIAQGFNQVGQLLLNREKVKSEVMKLLRYPLTLLSLCGLLLMLMFQFVFPHFHSFFSTMSNSPPLFVLLLMEFLSYFPYLILLFVFSCFIITILIGYKMKHWSSYE